MAILTDDYSPRYTGDTGDPLVIHFIDKTQATYSIRNYTPGSLSLKLVNKATGTSITGTGTWTVIDVDNGIVQYAFSSADVATAGIYDIVVSVTLPLGPKTFIPKVLEILPPA